MGRDWLDYFTGGVPTGQYFKISADNIGMIVNLFDENKALRHIDICYMGCISFFEAFCKDQFAAIINIIPDTASNLNDNNLNTDLDLAAALRLSAGTDQLGFILAEKYDFGSGQKINSLYRALLNISPFSKDEIAKYDRILRDRNLIVHHGGIYTNKYIEQQAGEGMDSSRCRAHFDSLRITKEYFFEDLKFLKSIVVKISNSSHNAINKIVAETNLPLDDQRRKAIDAFLWW